MTTAWYSVWFYNPCIEDWEQACSFVPENEVQYCIDSLKRRGFKLINVEYEKG